MLMHVCSCIMVGVGHFDLFAIYRNFSPLSPVARALSHTHTLFVSHHDRHHTGEQRWLLSGAIKGFDANQSSLSCQFGMMLEIYIKERLL